MMDGQSNQQLSEQSRARQAWDDVNRVEEGIQDKYGTLARKLPALLQTNGLGQTLAFLRAKGGTNPADANNVLYGQVSAWVMGRLGPPENDHSQLLEWIVNQRSDLYRRATVEAMAYAMWLRRFVEAQGLGGTGGD
jgi:CRISPR-associated protein Cmr5